MLRELHISNLAVISEARIELDPGLNCFTGATGAGKSLVIGAIELLLGLRSPAEMLRPGVEEAAGAPIAAEGGEFVLTRRLYASGRSSVSLNGNPITLGMLKQVAEHLVDVHGRSEERRVGKECRS